MVQPSGQAAVSKARQYTTCRLGMCLYYVQEWWLTPHAYPDAISQWKATIQHPGDRTPPVGAPVFYSGGKHGHVAIYVGNGKIRSTDCLTNGKVAESDLDWPKRKWGYPYLGWGGSLGGTKLPLSSDSGSSYPTPTSKKVYLSKLKYGTQNSDSVWYLQNSLNRHTLSGGETLPLTGNYLSETDEEVRLCQRQHGFGNDPVNGSFVGPDQANHIFKGSGLTIVNDL